MVAVNLASDMLTFVVTVSETVPAHASNAAMRASSCWTAAVVCALSSGWVCVVGGGCCGGKSRLDRGGDGMSMEKDSTERLSGRRAVAGECESTVAQDCCRWLCSPVVGGSNGIGEVDGGGTAAANMGGTISPGSC